MKSIAEIVDGYLEQMSKETYLMMTTGDVEVEMLDESIETENDWKGWKPIKSKLEESEIEKFEERIGYSLPLSYHEFLKYKYFYKFKIDDHAVNLFSNLPDRELNGWLNTINEFEISEELLKRGFLYFGDFSDYGYLCFNCNIPNENNEYPIYFVDHEDIDDIHFYTNNFRQILENDKDFGNRFIMKLNEYYEKQNNDT